MLQPLSWRNATRYANISLTLPSKIAQKLLFENSFLLVFLRSFCCHSTVRSSVEQLLNSIFATPRTLYFFQCSLCSYNLYRGGMQLNYATISFTLPSKIAQKLLFENSFLLAASYLVYFQKNRILEIYPKTSLSE